MFFHLHIALLSPRLLVCLEELHFEEVFLSRIECVALEVELISLTFASTECESCRRERLVGERLNRLSICIERPTDVVAGEVSEIVLIEDFNESLFGIHTTDIHILIYLFDFKILSFGGEVRTHHAIHAEHTVVGFVAKVTTIRPIASAIGSVVIHCLVYPVPDSTTHDEVIALNDVPIVN